MEIAWKDAFISMPATRMGSLQCFQAFQVGARKPSFNAQDQKPGVPGDGCKAVTTCRVQVFESIIQRPQLGREHKGQSLLATEAIFPNLRFQLRVLPLFRWRHGLQFLAPSSEGHYINTIFNRISLSIRVDMRTLPPTKDFVSIGRCLPLPFSRASSALAGTSNSAHLCPW